MDIYKLGHLYRTVEVIQRELVCIQHMLDDQVPNFYQESPELVAVVNQLWGCCCNQPLLNKLKANLLAEINQKKLGG